MTTPTREELLSALETGLECAAQIAAETHEKYSGYKPDRHEAVDRDVKKIKDAIALLSAHQAQGEPQGWREFIEQCAATDGGMVSGNQLSMRAKELLSGAPPSSAQTDQVWNEAVEAAAAQVLTFSRRKGDLCSIIAGEVLSLKRPLQAQEPASPAAQSGAVDERKAFEAAMRAQMVSDDDIRKIAARFDTSTDLAQRWRFNDVVPFVREVLSRAQAAPAVDLASVSDEYLLSHMSRYWEHQWHDGDQHQVRISRDQLASGIRALSRPSAPVSEQPAAQTAGVPEGWKLVPVAPTDRMIGAGIEAYQGKCEDSYRAMLAAAPQPVAEQVGEYSAAEQLSELLRGLEAGPECGAWPPTVLHKMGKAIAEQAKLAERQPAAQQVEDAAIGQFLMGLAKQNSAISWPRLYKIEWCGYAVTNEDDGYRNWTLREALAIAALQAGKEKEHGN